jgi:glycosidase
MTRCYLSLMVAGSLFAVACSRTVSTPETAVAVVEPWVLEVRDLEPRWWQQTIFYEIWPRSFKDSDGDGHGDFRGMTSKLDYLVELGVDGIWLTPIFEAPSYHGYDFVDFYAVEEDYGTMADFEEFMAEAHARGIRVILDLVINHISNEHPWFLRSAAQEAGYADYFIWRDELPQGWGLAWGGDPEPDAVWHWHEGRQAYYYGAFGPTQPDLNLENPAVVAGINEQATFWLEKGADGFRLDAVRYAMEEEAVDGARPAQADTAATIRFWSDFTAHVESIAPDALLVAEAWADMPTIAAYWDGGDGLHSAFDFDFGYVVIELLNGVERTAEFGTVDTAGRSSGRDALWDNLVARETHAPMAYYAPFLTNHDQNRVMHSLGDDVAMAKVAASLLLTSPGSVYLYYGEEIGMSQPLTGDDVYKRAIMQWEPNPSAGFNDSGEFWLDDGSWTPWMDDFTPWWTPYWESIRGQGERSVAEQMAQAGSLWQHYRKLIEARRQLPAIAVPQRLVYFPVDNPAIWLIQAERKGEQVLVVINLDTTAAQRFSVPVQLAGEWFGQLSKKSVDLGAQLELEAAATLVLSRR